MLRASDLRANPIEMEALKIRRPASKMKKKKRRLRYSRRNKKVDIVVPKSSLDCIEEEKKETSESEEL